jgi:hypothetical protein
MDEQQTLSQLADRVADYAASLFYEERGYGLNISENVAIGNAVYAAFDSANLAQKRKVAA